jgi:hypothetical protein
MLGVRRKKKREKKRRYRERESCMVLISVIPRSPNMTRERGK